jgi:sulfite reductase alpha subunit-like flavoprotein
MINENKKQDLDKLLLDLSKEQIIWINGYLAGKVEVSVQKTDQQSKLDIDKLTILYATETGNSKKIAIDLNKRIKSIGVKPNLKAIEQYNPSDFVKEKNLVFITSTHGEGELPETAKEFWTFLERKKPNLSKLKYAILSLGDSNYPKFCEAGKLLGNKFNKFGARQWLPIKELDLDFADYIDSWIAQLINLVTKPDKKDHIGKIKSNIILNDVGSNKEIHHIEIETNAKYQPGDSIGIKIGDNSPRLYSISSAIDAHEGEIHLTVKKVDNGLCSAYLADLKIGNELEFYVSPNNSFRLPDGNKDIIMIAAGTGIAPFRAFLNQRYSDGITGKNWLFFGEQYSHLDFLYQAELQDFLESGLLTKLTLAFSRDQEEKIYVQNRIKENANKIKDWLNNGAYLYICGDKEGMAKEVNEALSQSIGESTLNKLIEENRYLKDVY